jgi:hypothetical protein
LTRYAILLAALSVAFGADVYQGYTGRWESVVATAYSPHDGIDSNYHSTKGERWRWVTADGRTDVRWKPYGIAVPLKPGTRTPWWAFGTKVLIPAGQGYLDQSQPGDRLFTVDDVGNGREYFKTKRGKLHIDLRYMNTASAIKWGEKTIRVFVVTGVAQPDPAEMLFICKPAPDEPPVRPLVIQRAEITFDANAQSALLYVLAAVLGTVITWRIQCWSRLRR